MQAVPFELVSGLACEFGCVACAWRESEASFTGFVAEVWFEALPREFAVKWAFVVGYAVKVRRADGPAKFAVSVPCAVPLGQVVLGQASRGSRVRLVP